MNNIEEFDLAEKQAPSDEIKIKPRKQRGEPYTLERFRQHYGLGTNEARDLFRRFGPSSIELDLLMQAKGRSPEN